MSLLQKLFGRKSGPAHTLSPRQVDPDALTVLHRLNGKGFTAYLVGGGVRDLLLGRTPKDFDVVTDAFPKQIKKIFGRQAFIIGRRFQLVLIFFGHNREKQIETATFRRDPEAPKGAGHPEREGALYQVSDNCFGTPEEDAYRRDFTVNALFWDPKSGEIIDHTGGLADLSAKVLRCIGDPNVRFREDPVRMLRAIRLSSRLGFTIHADSLEAIRRYGSEISSASRPRLFEELLRLFTFGKSRETLFRLHETGLMKETLPKVDAYVGHTGKERSPLWRYLERLDAVSDSFDTEHRESPEFVQENAIRLAVLLVPLYREWMSTLGAVSPGRVAEALVEEVVVAPFLTPGWRVPRALCDDLSSILASLVSYRDSKFHRRAFIGRPWFSTALRFWHIVAEAENDREAKEALAAWDKQFAEYVATPHPPRAGSYVPTDPDKAGAQGFPGDEPEDRDALFPNGRTPPPKRKRRRGGRHRRGSRGAGGSSATPPSESSVS